jgi:hypothetical protein
VKRSDRIRFLRTKVRSPSKSMSIAPVRRPFAEAASCQTYMTFPRGLLTSSESIYATGPSLTCSATIQDREFVCFSNQRI